MLECQTRRGSPASAAAAMSRTAASAAAASCIAAPLASSVPPWKRSMEKAGLGSCATCCCALSCFPICTLCNARVEVAKKYGIKESGHSASVHVDQGTQDAPLRVACPPRAFRAPDAASAPYESQLAKSASLRGMSPLMVEPRTPQQGLHFTPRQHRKA